MRSASVLLRECKAEETLIGAFIVRRKEDEALFSQVIDVTDCVRGRWLNCDIPDGFWRAFFLYDTQAYANPDYIDMLNEESVRVLIDAVYEPHYARYHSYFGNTFQGFFPMNRNFETSAIRPPQSVLGFTIRVSVFRAYACHGAGKSVKCWRNG